MNKIELHNTLPCVFDGRDVQSEIWLQDVTLQKGETYLVEASSGTGKSSLSASVSQRFQNSYGDSILAASCRTA